MQPRKDRDVTIIPVCQTVDRPRVSALISLVRYIVTRFTKNIIWSTCYAIYHKPSSQHFLSRFLFSNKRKTLNRKNVKLKNERTTKKENRKRLIFIDITRHSRWQMTQKYDPSSRDTLPWYTCVASNEIEMRPCFCETLYARRKAMGESFLVHWHVQRRYIFLYRIRRFVDNIRKDETTTNGLKMFAGPLCQIAQFFGAACFGNEKESRVRGQRFVWHQK